MKKTKQLLVLMISSLLLASCGSSVEEVSIGKEFLIEDAPITISKFEASNSIRTKDDKEMKFAPEGKKFIYFEVKNPEDQMIFLEVFSNGQELDYLTDVMYYTHKVNSGFEDNYYLVDEDIAIDKIVISTPGGISYVVNNPTIAEGNNVTISDEVKQIIASYSPDKPIGLLEGFSPFVEDGKSVFDIATQKGLITASNTMSKEAEVEHISKDGKTYSLKIKSILDSYATVTSNWENGKVKSITVVE